MQSRRRFGLKRRSAFRRALPIIGAAAIVMAIGAAGYFYLVPHVVAGTTVEATSATLEIRGPALLDAIDKVVVTARIQGFLKTIEVDKNDLVTKGQLLATIDAEDFESQLAGARADAAASEQAVVEVRASLESLTALAEKAKIEYDRKRALVPSGAASQADLTTTETAFKQANAERARAAATIERLAAQNASAEANVRLLEVRLGYAMMRSPLNGIVVSKDRSVGDLLTPGIKLMEIVDPNTLILTARFDESVLDVIRPGQRVAAHFTSDATRPLKGTVFRLRRQVDEETREFKADIKLDEPPAMWALNGRASVVVYATTRTIVLSENLISRRRGRVGVWKLEDGRATWVPISLGYTALTSIQVVSGLVAGDVVLVPRHRYEWEPINVHQQQTATREPIPQ
uniref:Putative efflux RND transporter protein n=1 Tax=uncultured bacterium B7P37metaSE TaxID=670783 RepID=C8CIJ4_9BACT|nr:putative efflux RND transporter protein [uncultured bacterium B7P37metaSE]